MAIFDDLLDKLGGNASKLDPRKLVDLVDDLWDQREKIVAAVDFVWDNKDSIAAAVGFMQDNADELIDLGKRLPGFLTNAGEALATAGDGAHTASLMILGEDGDGVRELAADAAAALERCRDELWAVMGLFDRAGSGLADLPVIGDVATPLVDGAGRIGKVSDDLGAVARRLRGLGDQLTEAGQDLGWVGDSLGASGVALQRFAPEREATPDYFFDPGAATPKTKTARSKPTTKPRSKTKTKTKAGTKTKTKAGTKTKSKAGTKAKTSARKKPTTKPKK